jgi:hypothetical protein
MMALPSRLMLCVKKPVFNPPNGFSKFLFRLENCRNANIEVLFTRIERQIFPSLGLPNLFLSILLGELD